MLHLGYVCLQCASACFASLSPRGGLLSSGVCVLRVLDPMSQRMAPYVVGPRPYFGNLVIWLTRHTDTAAQDTLAKAEDAVLNIRC
jgi:hypothetical protein